MANQPPSSKLEPWHDLNGKVVMVTGASSGLGRDFCLDLAKAGCRIVAAARRIDRLVSLCEEINLLGTSGNDDVTDNVRAVAVELDVSAKGPTIEALVNKAWEAFGRIDSLINNAGVRGKVHSLLELVEDEWDSTMRTNLTGTWLVSKYVSARGLAYASSKTGVNTLTKVMAMELGMYKIRVNSINPGLFRSEITQGLMEKEWLDNVARRTVPLKTFGAVDPGLTRLARYLIHESSEYVSGNVFIVDAGVILPGLPIFSSL
ncbi:hypothetical protein L1987_59967 [Smallanthus sonchifolius]|uniref:Uncharacterized protein n=1 Tax=Smallanthus sonchifolius TaxID=185202 RepID=A0ACB9D7K6_9ASTR|nr:hypothetical protein L1987_59967 [Smallanthus sonchifolius]